MLASMTGYGRVQKQYDSFSITVEMKSVNHRFCEVNIRLPRQLMMLEEKIKKTVLRNINRGRVEVFITIEGNTLSNKTFQVDWELLKQYHSVLHNMKQVFELKDEITLNLLLNRAEIVEVIETDTENLELEHAVIETVQQATMQLREMRLNEGKELYKDLKINLGLIEECTEIVSNYAPLVVEQYREKLMKRVAEFTEGSIDQSRVLTEVALFADKADINEEITRIKSHLSQFHMTIDENQEVIGRKLDFLVQELNREVNTIGSKANDIRIAQQVVNMKTGLEKLKEQVQNIE
ncbi:YicC/YloC family endoribonuclease [Bacillus salitolerans]|uniref:YicC/YloC family endoribonuclease n=1 Tax=Bacillus salitolerans TaxID=1437434 RepID=A0ABW4LM08_9BACI